MWPVGKLFRSAILLCASLLWICAHAQNSQGGNTYTPSLPTVIASPANNQCLVYQSSTSTWVNGSCSSGGGATVTGSPVNGNLAFFSGAGTISSGNLSGDCTTSGTGVLACTKTGGVAFAPSATTDTTNATNITSGQLPNLSQLPSIPSNTILGNSSGSTAAPSILPKDMVNALDPVYCAAVVNNSGSDAGPCIQSALTDGSSLGRCVLFPGGIYYVKSQITVPAGGCMRGVGWDMTNTAVGTWFWITSSQFMAGGPHAGAHPFVLTSNRATVDNIAFTEDQPADTVGWTPNNYGSMFFLSNASHGARFTNIYIGGVYYFMDVHSWDGLFLENITGQIYGYGFFIEHNADWLHASHFHINDYACSPTNCPNVTTYQRTNAVLFQSNRNDEPNWVDINAFDLNTTFNFGTDATGVTSGGRINIADCDECYSTINVTANGTNIIAESITGHTYVPGGGSILQGGTIVTVSGNSNNLDLIGVQANGTGDSAISVTGTSNVVQLTHLWAHGWGDNAVGGAACNTIYALNLGTGNTFRGSELSFTPSCSTLNYALGVNAYGISNGGDTSFTPVLNFGGGTTGITYVSTATGGVWNQTYNMITVQFTIDLSAVGSSTGIAAITGLSAPANSSGRWGAAGNGICQADGMAGLTSTIVPKLASNSTTMTLLEQGSTGTTSLTNANFTNSSLLRCTFSYRQ